jgi:drug/metabolite transporter (DMT)-like permease
MEFLWCIVVTTCIGIGFKLFSRFGINTFNAIVINYTVCLLLGSILDPEMTWPFSGTVIRAPWFKYDILLGFLFIIGFNLTANSIQRAGITLTTLIQRMSLILTVSFTVILFHEHFGWLEFAGLLLAISAIIAINQKTSFLSLSFSGSFPVILVAVLVFSAAIEILLFYVEKTGAVGQQQLAFTTHGFGVAAILGWLALGITFFKGTFKFTRKDILAGILLGLPNFFSIFLILRMLNMGWQGSIMYPMINISVLLLSTFAAVFIFKERLNRLNWIGIGFACMAILVIAYAHNLSHYSH